MPRKFLLAVFALLVGCGSALPATEVSPSVDSPSGLLLSAAECVETPKDNAYPRFARLMHDPQWMEWPSRMGDPDWPNGYYFDWYPETVQLWTGPRGGDGRFAYSKPWLEYLRELQPNDAAAVWMVRIAAGLFNRGNEFIPILNLEQLKTQPVAESISSGGNVIKVLETRNGSGRIEMIFFKQAPPSIEKVNYEKTPWLVTKFTSVSIEGELGNAGGIDVYFPNLSKQKKGLWVDLDRVEWFPKLPICVAADGELNVRSGPGWGAAVSGSLAAGQVVLVTEYLPQGSDVFGKTPLGWIVLEYQSNGQPIYPTSWEMETRPPIVFD